MPDFQLTGASRWLRRLCLAAALGSLPQYASAQTPAAPTPPPAPAPAVDLQPGEQVFQVLSRNNKITLTHLDTRVLELTSKIRMVDGFNPDKLTVTAMTPHRVRLRAENPGVTTVKLIDEFENTYQVEVFVRPDTRELKAYLEDFFPGSAISVTGLKDEVVLAGWVTEPAQIPQIMEIAEAFYPKVHSQLVVGGTNQVQLHVKVMEVQRTKLRELGFNFLAVGQQYYVSNAIGGLAPLQNVIVPFGGPPQPTIIPSSVGNSEISFAIAGNNDTFQGFIKALQSEALAKILAEPVLVTTSGRPARIHSGGEFPILVPQSFGNLSIQWREFGVQMEAVPVVLGNGRVRLDLAPEVSERDFSNSVTVNGLVVPGITSRSVNTQVELRFGETLMIGGLISSRKLTTSQKVPFLGELPWVGTFFSRKSSNVGETELVILVTPQLVAPMLPGQVPCGGPGLQTTVPTDHELYIDGFMEVPQFGPECPECESQLIMPADMAVPPPAVPQPPPVGLPPAMLNSPVGPTEVPPPIQQTSGLRTQGRASQAVYVNAFEPESGRSDKTIVREPASRAESKANGPVATPATVTLPPKNSPRGEKPRTALIDGHTLPGLIQPKQD